MTIIKNKPIQFIIFVVFLFLLLSTHIMANDTKYILSIDLQTGFKGHNVKLYVNEQLVINLRGVTSSASTGYAGHVKYKARPGVYEISLLVNGAKIYKQKIVIDRDMYLGIGLRDKFSAYYMFSNKPFLYD